MQALSNKLNTVTNKLPMDKIRKGVSLIAELLFVTALFIFAGQIALAEVSLELKLLGYASLGALIVFYSESKLAYHKFMSELEDMADNVQSLEESVSELAEAAEEQDLEELNEQLDELDENDQTTQINTND